MADPEVRPALTLEGLADGAAAELWDAAHRAVLESIADLNTDWNKARTITLEFKYEPDEARQTGRVTIKCSTKLPGLRGIETFVSFGQRLGERVAVEHARQATLFPPNQQQGKPRAVEAAGGDA
jgi:hypothetical protein